MSDRLLVVLLMWMVGVMFAAIVAMIGAFYRGFVRRTQALQREIELMSVYQHNFVRVVFALLHKLHPGQGVLISESLQNLMDARIQQRANGAVAGGGD